MTRARITILRPNGTITLAESADYTALNSRDTWDEYGSVAHTMHNNAKQFKAPQELKDDLTKLRLDIVQAHQGQSTPMPTHDEFVAAVDKYNAWASAQPFSLDTPAQTPTSPPAPKAPVKAPTTDDKSDTEESQDETTVDKTDDSDDDSVPAWVRHWHAVAVKPLDDAVFGVDNKPGLVARVEALENGNVLHDDGTSVPWHSRTYAVGNYNLRVMPAILAFVVTYALLIFISWAIETDTGIWATIGYWQAGFAAAVAALVLLVTNIHRNTAPAVVREGEV